MATTNGTSRAGFLAGTAAAGAAGALGPAGRARATGRRPGLRHRGVVHTVGEGETPATGWNVQRMRADPRAIRHDPHAVTRTVHRRPGHPEAGWHWEPKQGFHALARHYASSARG